jgi:hypothetical protein
MYGTIVDRNGSTCVQLDGSDLATPVTSVVDTVVGDRVTVTIKNHTAIVTGNLSSPAARTDDVQNLESDVNDLVVDNATVKQKLSAYEAEFTTAKTQYLSFEKATGDDLTSIHATIEELDGKTGNFESVTTESLDAITGRITALEGKTANFESVTTENLDAVNGRITALEGDTADFKSVTTNTLQALGGQIDNLSGEYSAFKTSVSDEMITAKGWMAEGSIGNAQISSVDAVKIKSGTLDTSIVTVAGSDGKLQIVDNTIQISDDSRVRVQIGKDASGDYTLAVWDSTGKLIWDALGATENTIQRKIIRDAVVADDANIQGYKLDINSVVTSINGATTKISGTVVLVGNKSLTVALSEQTETLSDYGETLSDHTTKISANEQAIKLKVSSQDYESYKQTVDGKIQNAESRLSTAESSITTLQGSIALKVTQTDIDTAITNLQIGGAQILLNTNSGVLNSGDITKNWYSASGGNGTVSVNTLDDSPIILLKYGYTITGNTSGNKDIIQKNVPFKNGTTYTASWYVKGTCTVLFRIYNQTDIKEQYKYTKAINTSTWTRMSATFTANSEFESDSCSYQIGLTGSGEIQICGMKLEEGSKATSWLPSSEDVDNSISAVDAKFSDYSTTTQMNAAIEVAKTNITSTVSSTYATKSEVTTVSGKVSSLESWKEEASQKITKDGIVATVGNYYSTQTDIDTAVNGIEVGGAQILRGTNSVTALTSSGAWSNGTWRNASGGTGTRTSISVSDAPNPNIKLGWTLTETSGAVDIAQDNVPVSNGQTYTMSCYAKGTGTLRLQYGKNPWPSKTYVLSDVTSWTKYSYTFAIGEKSDGSTNGSTNIYFGNGTTGTIQICGMKLEEGSKATSWLPSSEDVESSVSAVQTIATQTADKFTWLVASGTSSTDFTLTDRTATLVANYINLKGVVTFSGLDSTAQGKITTAQSTADTAKNNAATAQSTADTATTNAATAQSTANSAVTAASNAQSTADTAKTNAATAQSTADTAKNNAATAQSTADKATSAASTAQSTADNAATAASNAQATANTANAKATYQYAECTTAAGTAAKTATLSGFTLFTGATVSIRFNNGNTAASPTLNVNSTGAKSIVINGTSSPTAAQAALSAYDTCIFTYDGSYWRLVGTDATVRTANNAQSTANTAKSNASTAQTAAEAAQSTANTATTNAATAQSTANSATTAAATAQSTADKATSAASTAQSTADAAKTDAATAQSTANTAKTNAATAQSTAESAQSTANSAATAASNAQATANAAKPKVITTFTGGGDSKSYALLATITTNKTYINTPLIIEINQRGYGLSTIEIKWTNANNTDPTLEYIRHDGDNTIYIYKSDTATWQLYVKKSEAWGVITVTDLININALTVTWTCTNADLPSSGYVASVKNPDSIYNAYTSGTTTIDGGKITTGSIVASKLSVTSLSAISANLGTVTSGIIKSTNYSYTSGNYTDAGTYIDLSTGLIRTKNFGVDSSGNAYFKGSGTFSGAVTATSGSFGKMTITNYLTTNASRTSYNQATTGMTIDTNGIGAWGSSTQYWNMTNAGKLTATGVDIKGSVDATTLYASNEIKIRNTELDTVRTVITYSCLTDDDDNPSSTLIFLGLSGGNTDAWIGFDEIKNTTATGHIWSGAAPFTIPNLIVSDSFQCLGGSVSLDGHTHINIQASNKNGIAITSGGDRVLPMVGGSTTSANAHNQITIGSSGTRFKEIWSVQALNTSSDRNLKTDFHSFDKRYEEAYMDFEPCIFRFKNFTDTDNHDRMHFGFVAQDIETVLHNHDITNQEAAFLCVDHLSEPNAAGELVEYSMRYGELEALHTHMTQKAHRRLDDHDIQLLRIDSTISKYEAQLYSVQYQLQQAFMLIAQQEKMLKQLIKEESSC